MSSNPLNRRGDHDLQLAAHFITALLPAISNINCRLNPYYMTADCGMRSRMRHFQTASVCLNRMSARRVAIYRGELSCLCF